MRRSMGMDEGGTVEDAPGVTSNSAISRDIGHLTILIYQWPLIYSTSQRHDAIHFQYVDIRVRSSVVHLLCLAALPII